MIRLTRATPILAGCLWLGLAQAQTQTQPEQQPLLRPVDPATGQPLAQRADQNAALQARLAALEARLGRLEKVFENQVVRELLQSVDGLQAEIRELRGEIEGQYHELEVLQTRQRDLYRDSDRRLRDLELGLSTGAAAASAGVATGLPEAPQPSAPPPAASQATTVQPPAATGAAVQPGATVAAAAATQTPAVNEADEKAAYVAAFEYLKTGQYAEAITAYQSFLDKYPSGRYADNAQYWMGEANYVSREFQEALTQFQKVVANYPSSPKVSDARLKIGFALYEMQRWDDARTALEQVVRDYPDTSVARLARQRIVRMKKEGH